MSKGVASRYAAGRRRQRPGASSPICLQATVAGPVFVPWFMSPDQLTSPDVAGDSV